MDAIGALLRPTPYSVQALRRAGWDAPQHQHSSATCVSTSRTRVQPECEPWRQRRRRVAAGASLPGSSGSSSSGGFPAGSPAGAASPPVASPPISDDDIVCWNWAGQDDFTPLNDRRDAPPLPLPRLRQSKRLVLVRHGQSTWNARNRIQGSSDFAVLTEQGVKQAHAARELLAPWDFECMFVSPLKRARETGDIVWGGRQAPTIRLPSLREIDLYSFQGLDKMESRALYTSQWASWQGTPAEFVIDGHAPVRELWFRASLAWQEVLFDRNLQVSGLVVAHNAVIQALLCTALGLPPSFFRRFSQSNAAFTVLEFQQDGNEVEEEKEEVEDQEAGVARVPRVLVERMNQFPDTPLKPTKLGKSQPLRLVLITGSAASPAVQTSLGLLASNGVTAPPMIAIGSAQQQALDIQTAVQASLATPGDGRTVLAVACAAACQALLSECLGPVEPPAGATSAVAAAAEATADAAAAAAAAAGDPLNLSPRQQRRRQATALRAVAARPTAPVGAAFKMSEGGITIVNWPAGAEREMGRGVILCTNYQLPPSAEL